MVQRLLLLHRAFRVDELLRVEHGVDEKAGPDIKPARAPHREKWRGGVEHKLGRVEPHGETLLFQAVQPAFPWGPFPRERPFHVPKPLFEPGRPFVDPVDERPRVGRTRVAHP